MEAHARFLAQQEAVHREAQRIASLSAMKLFRSRVQRGGMRLHRSLQLALVMKSARELIISSAQAPHTKPLPATVPMEVTRESRKRRSCGSRLPEAVLPSKRACLWQETPHPQPQGGAFPGLAEVLQQLLLRTVPPLPGGCRTAGADNMAGVHARVLEAF
ncbi:immediate early response gene 2 protein [Bufo gargarizans]|uniref:immediate early response gene 2 protein n=1 Tax=Bufo gargarizans TaxID=30331 RepID=UPI001CF2BE6E|nr:immediate early response gene 2 protein [Bufo gargarizans]